MFKLIKNIKHKWSSFNIPEIFIDIDERLFSYPYYDDLRRQAFRKGEQ